MFTLKENRMRTLLLSLCTMCALGSFAQETTKLTAAKHNKYGLIYTLPRTQVEIEALVTKTTVKVGPFYQYAERFLGTPATITQDAETYSLDKVQVFTQGVPDKEQQYLVQFKSGSTPFIYLDKEGVILAINTDPVAEAAIEPLTPQPKKYSLEGNSYYSVFSEDLLLAGSTNKMAEEAAKQLYHIRESKVNLITGDVDQIPADGESYKVIINQLDQQEQSLVALFMGTVETEQYVKRFRITPSDSLTDEVAFRFSTKRGIVSKDDLGGSPVYLNLKVTERGELPTNEKGEPMPLPKKGLVYCIPGYANINLQLNGKELFNGNFQIAQFGVKYALDPSMFVNSKKGTAQVTFYPQTGAIREIKY